MVILHFRNKVSERSCYFTRKISHFRIVLTDVASWFKGMFITFCCRFCNVRLNQGSEIRTLVLRYLFVSTNIDFEAFA